jgi:ABC-type branched-subunit amino acid transport system substrate-binding protein
MFQPNIELGMKFGISNARPDGLGSRSVTGDLIDRRRTRRGERDKGVTAMRPGQDRGRGPLARTVSRRNFMRLAVAGTASAGLAACGSSGPSGAELARMPRLPSNFDAEMTAFLKKTFGGPHSGAGLKFPFAAGLLLSTSQAPYGEASLKGIKLAVKHIAAAGGPDFSFSVKDFAASTTAGATDMTAWGQSSIPYCISCGFFDEGNVIKSAIQYKVLTTDPGGGDLPAFQGAPYIWGTRAVTPLDAYPGVMQYLAAKMPKAKKIATAGADLGPLTSEFVDSLRTAMKQHFPGSELVAQEYTEQSTSATYDYGPALIKLEGVNPDVILPFTWGTDPASFMKAYFATSLTGKVIGPDYFASSATLAGSAIVGYQFAYDYFNPSNPGNTWGKMFAEAYEKEYGEFPDYYPANYYENTFFLWQLISRVLEKGGDPLSGSHLQSALEEDTTLMSLYGTGNSTGSLTLGSTSHTPTSRPMGLFEVKSSSTTALPKQLASFNIGGADFATL